MYFNFAELINKLYGGAINKANNLIKSKFQEGMTMCKSCKYLHKNKICILTCDVVDLENNDKCEAFTKNKEAKK